MTWICLVDDDVEVCDVLTDALRGAGYEVRAFVDGSDALEAIDQASSPPELVLLNLLLPHMSGQDVLKQLRRGQHAPDVPVIVITGLDVNAAAFDPPGVAAVLRKPVAVDQLLAAVRRAI